MEKMCPYVFTYICLLFSVTSLAQKPGYPSGIYVISIMGQMPNSETLVELFPKDSIFLYGNMGLEKLLAVHDLEMNNSITQTVVGSGYNLIDWDKGTFIYMEKLISPYGLSPLSLTQQRIGIDFYYQYYNNEKFSVEYIETKNARLKKIFYTSTLYRIKGAEITAFFDVSKKTNAPKIMINLDTKFEGRLTELKVKFPDNKGSQIWQIQYLPVTEHKYIDYLKDLYK